MRAIEKLLADDWTGGPCLGTLTFRGDGTFERQHYRPGNNALRGTWKLRWDALPPTLVMHCTKSDDPDRVGQTSEVKLVQLDDESLAYQNPGSSPTVYKRAKK
ncbi:MAG: hypothetical protein C0483_09720 [Pirellula sp.]|nr:hypothetical protein [Pirellula sp.]